MNDDGKDDPFARKKRSNKTTKRRRRTERIDINAKSDDEEEVAPLLLPKPRVKRGVRCSSNSKSRPKAFAIPKDLYEEKNYVKMNVEDEEHRPDYSAAGLQRLRQLTSNKPPDSVPRVIDVDALDESNDMRRKNRAIELTELREDVGKMNLKRKTFKCEACGKRFDENDALQRHLTDAHINAPTSGMGFVQRERERTEDKLGVLDDMEDFEVQNYGSGAEEWEREQLRRVGLSVSNKPTVVADNMARAVIEEEDLNLMNTSHGEMGHSVLDLFFEGLEEAIHGATHRKNECEKKIASVRSAIVECERKQKLAVERQKEAALREIFYGKLMQFASDVFDMLAEKQDVIDELYKFRMEKFEAEAEKIRKEVEGEKDEFGRSIDPVDMLRRRMEEEKDKMEIGEIEDIFEDVDKNYKSISRICDRFREWRELYPKDYEQAHGDKTVGKICGSITMANREVDLNWIHQVPKAARNYALQASHTVDLFAVFLRARWDIYSMSNLGFAGKFDFLEYIDEKEKKTLVDAVLWRVKCEYQLVLRAEKEKKSDNDLVGKAKNLMLKRTSELLNTDFGLKNVISRLEFMNE